MEVTTARATILNPTIVTTKTTTLSTSGTAKTTLTTSTKTTLAVSTTEEPKTTTETPATLEESDTGHNLVVICAIIAVFFCLILLAAVFWIIRCYTTDPFEIGFSRCHRQRHPNYVRPPLVLWRRKNWSYGFDSDGRLRKWKRASILELHSLQSDKCESTLKIDPEFLNADFIQMATYPSANTVSNVQTQESGVILPIANLPIIIDNQADHSIIF